MKKKMWLVITGACMCVFIEAKAQHGYGTPFIINDKDGYTNIRKEPNGKSEIVGKVYKHEVFVSAEGCEDIEVSPPSIPWLLVWNDKTWGYIYKKNITQLYELPFVETTNKTTDCLFDNVCVVVEFTPFDTITAGKNSYGLMEEYYEKDETGQRKNCCNPSNKIKIELNYKLETLLLTDKLKNCYYECHGTAVNSGSDGELYIGITGGGDASAYYAWVTVLNGEVLQEFVMTSCW